MKLADRIRKHVIEEIIIPARKAGNRHVVVDSGDVHEAMGLQNRMPAVCGALDAAKFEEEANVVVIERSGPRQSSTVEWVLRIR